MRTVEETENANWKIFIPRCSLRSPLRIKHHRSFRLNFYVYLINCFLILVKMYVCSSLCDFFFLFFFILKIFWHFHQWKSFSVHGVDFTFCPYIFCCFCFLNINAVMINKKAINCNKAREEVNHSRLKTHFLEKVSVFDCKMIILWFFTSS